MKKLIIIALFFFSFTGTIVTIPFARSASPTPTPEKKASLTEKISQLKDRIASRVTELKLVEKKGVIGTVQEASETKIKLEDVQGTTQIIDVDEITKFASPTATAKETFGISDIKKGATISVLGLYNKESKRILARFIGIVQMPSFTKGTISEIDKKKFTITVKTDAGKEMVVDIENSTTLLQVSPEGEMVRYSFSKLLQNDIVYLVSSPDKKEDNRFSALRVLVLSALLKTEAKTTPEPTGKKTQLTPTASKSTPTVTSKPTKTPTPTKSNPTPTE